MIKGYQLSKHLVSIFQVVLELYKVVVSCHKD